MDIRQDLFQFKWGVCIDGYRGIISREGYNGSHDYLEPNSVNYRFYQPATDCPDLIFRFARMSNTVIAANEFVNEFGSIGLDSLAPWNTSRN